MMASHTLFIVVSNNFRDAYLRDRKDDDVQLSNSTLVALKEPVAGMPNPWGNYLQGLIIREIERFKGWPNLRVRVAGHIGPCFGWKNDETDAPRKSLMRDRLFPDKGEGLREMMGADLDVQVWGFHGDKDWSGIWRVLTTAELFTTVGTSDNDKGGFEMRLLEAFEDSQAEDKVAEEADWKWARYEHLSVITHDILSLFTPLRIKLDTAAERDAAAAQSDDEQYRESARAKAKRLRDEVNQHLPDKLLRACTLLEEAAHIVNKEKDNEWWKMAAAKLKMTPSLDREEFWLWVGELSDILKNLVRGHDE